MLTIVVLTLLAGALGVPTTQPGASTTVNSKLLATITTSFNTIDADSNGQLEVSEFYKVFDQYDTDHDHKMTSNEYMQGRGFDKEFDLEVFKYLDHDHDNVLNRGETNGIYKLFDGNDDGTISIAEYINEYKTRHMYIQPELLPPESICGVTSVWT